MSELNFNSVEEILKFALEKEKEAARFYEDLSRKASDDAMKKVFLSFAKEEKKHEALILGILNGKEFKSYSREVVDLKISDHLKDVTPSEDMDYQDAIRIAMQREKASFKLYSDLAEKADNEDMRNILLSLAQEEAKHKLKLETIYDDIGYPEN